MYEKSSNSNGIPNPQSKHCLAILGFYNPPIQVKFNWEIYMKNEPQQIFKLD